MSREPSVPPTVGTNPPVKTTLYFPRDVHHSLKVEAAERRMTITAIIIEALENRTFMVGKAQP